MNPPGDLPVAGQPIRIPGVEHRVQLAGRPGVGGERGVAVDREPHAAVRPALDLVVVQALRRVEVELDDPLVGRLVAAAAPHGQQRAVRLAGGELDVELVAGVGVEVVQVQEERAQ